MTGGRRRGLALVVEPSGDRRDPKPVVVTESSWSGRVGAADFVGEIQVLGTLRVPKNADYRSGRGKRDLASTLRNSAISAPRQQAKAHRPAASDAQLADLRARMRAHPAHTGQRAPELDRTAERYARLEREVTASAATVRATTSSLAVTFERIVALLGDRGYIDTVDGASELTESGHRLARVYSESDLLVCECIEDGVFDGLDPAGLAAVVSTMVFESRGERGGAVLTGEKVPGAVRSAVRDVADRWTDIVAAEAAHRLEPSREPDVGFVAPLHQWASGGTLAAVLLAAGERGRPLPAGDFVRWCRQVIDLLDQIKQTSFETAPGLATVATAAIAAVRRGVVAESGA
ncbi:hypothetical protein MTP03_24640 [Tsukamurella sp. PLM1]|nr:hypothetical protein MTP03_24640 [Tsukamurella sp. PLM1]